jgi:hypothetical protein
LCEDLDRQDSEDGGFLYKVLTSESQMLPDVATYTVKID